MKLILMLIVLTGCSFSKLQSRHIENYFQSAGVEKYFLSELPSWANYSEKGKCFRQTAIRYFDVDQLMKSLNLDFNHAIQIQASYNNDLINLQKEFVGKVIPLDLEQNLFFKATEKVNGKILFFEAPTFKRIHLIWIDSMLESNDAEKRVKQFIKSSVNDQGVPVLVSMCLSKKEIEEKLPEMNFKVISSELFSIYSPNGSTTPTMKFYFDNFFKAGQELIFYSNEKMQNSLEFNGKIKFINF